MHLSQAEALVRRLPGVSACRILVDAEGRVAAVHVTAAAGASPAGVAADVVTVLAAEAGLDVDPGLVHVAVLPAGLPPLGAGAPSPAETRPEPPAPAQVQLEELEQEVRPRILALNLMVTEERSLAEVELAQGSLSALGRAESRGAGTAPELMAQACLDALEKISGARVALRLVAWKLFGLGPAQVCCVLVQESEGRGERLLVGAAPVHGDPSRASAYAALDAVNRRLGRILVGPTPHYDIS